MYNRSISFKVLFLKPPHIQMTLLQTNNLQSIKYYGILRRYNQSIPQCRNFMRNLCDVALMSFGRLRFNLNMGFSVYIQIQNLYCYNMKIYVQTRQERRRSVTKQTYLSKGSKLMESTSVSIKLKLYIRLLNTSDLPQSSKCVLYGRIFQPLKNYPLTLLCQS